MAKRKKKGRGVWPAPPEDKPYQCEFCGANYAREKSYINHTCKYKARWLWQDNRDYKLALDIQRTHRKMHGKKEPSFEEFMYSPYFDAFVKFANYIIKNDIVESRKFIEYVFKHSVPIDSWCTDEVYEQYIRHYVTYEHPDIAMTRNIKLMEQWAQDTGNHWTDFFERIPTTLAVKYIRTGRLSPWVVYALESAQIKLLARMSVEQLTMIEEYAPISDWKKRFSTPSGKDGKARVQLIFKQAGL